MYRPIYHGMHLVFCSQRVVRVCNKQVVTWAAVCHACSLFYMVTWYSFRPSESSAFPMILLCNHLCGRNYYENTTRTNQKLGRPYFLAVQICGFISRLFLENCWEFFALSMDRLLVHIAIPIKQSLTNIDGTRFLALYWPDWIIIMSSMKQHLEGYTRTQRAYFSRSHKWKWTILLLALGVTQCSVMGQTKYIWCIPIPWIS